MRTTLKRGVGRSAARNGNGRAVLPPSVLTDVTLYRQPPRPRRGVLHLLFRALLWLVASAAVVGTGLAGGLYLYIEEDVVGAVKPRTREVREAAKQLEIAPPGEPAIALVVGYDKRAFGPTQVDSPRS